MSVSDWAGALADWRDGLEDMKAFVAPAFKRSGQRVSAGAFIDGLLSGVERKTGWMLAQEAGLARPTGYSRCRGGHDGRRTGSV